MNPVTHIKKYQGLISDNLKKFQSEHKAMEASVGGNYDRVGIKELLLLKKYGLKDESYIIDVGCGSGRLSKQLATMPSLKYHGTDIDKRLLKYAGKMSNRPDFKFSFIDKDTLISIPDNDNTADMVCFFSVFTHLLHEQSAIYLEEAKRVCKDSGIIVFSFLEATTSLGKDVLKNNIETLKNGNELPHLNVLMSRDLLEHLANSLKLKIIDIKGGDNKFIEVKDERHMPYLEPGIHTFGQSVAVLSKS